MKMQFLMPSVGGGGSYPTVDDYRELILKVEELQRQLNEQSKEIFDLKWELSSLKYSLIYEANPSKEHALLNDVVLRRLAFFLSKGDLLNCRLVCKKWNNAVLPRIRQQFYFHFKQHYGWLLIYLIIYAVILMPRILMGSNAKGTTT